MQSRARVFALALATLYVGAGCQDLGTNTGQDPLMEATVVARDFEPAESWEVVATYVVSPGTSTRVEGSRYALTFSPYSLVDDLEVTIKERDPNVVDVELGPDGSEFYKPVTLEVDYRGTRFDPDHPDYRGPGRLYWFDPGLQDWVLVPGTNDPKTCTYSARLEHFSRYAMGDGTSGWEDELRDQEEAIK